MNVLSRILATLVALALSKLGTALGMEFTEADREAVTLWAVALFTVLYGVAHPIIRTQLVKRWPWLFQDPRLATAPGPTPQMAPAPAPTFEQWMTPPSVDTRAIERAVEAAFARAGVTLAPVPNVRKSGRKFTPRPTEREPDAEPSFANVDGSSVVAKSLRRAGRRKSDPVVPEPELTGTPPDARPEDDPNFGLPGVL
jgi:hypothetical protein